jgi:hypothetical protein
MADTLTSQRITVYPPCRNGLPIWPFRGMGNSWIVVGVPSERKAWLFTQLQSYSPFPIEPTRAWMEKEAAVVLRIGRRDSASHIHTNRSVASSLAPFALVSPHDPILLKAELRATLLGEVSLGFSGPPEALAALQAVPECCFVELLEDFGGTPDDELTWTLELKPKWGSFPVLDSMELRREGKGIQTHTHNSDLNTTSAARVCRFQMMQHFKAKKKSPSALKLSRYCPIRLFNAPSAEEMVQQLQSLLDSPQNNLRLSVNGTPIPHSPPSTGDAPSEGETNSQIQWTNAVGFLMRILTEPGSEITNDLAQVLRQLRAAQSQNLVEAEQLVLLESHLATLDASHDDDVVATLVYASSADTSQQCWCNSEHLVPASYTIRSDERLVNRTLQLRGRELEQFVREEKSRFYHAMTARDVSILIQFGYKDTMQSGEPGQGGRVSDSTWKPLRGAAKPVGEWPWPSPSPSADASSLSSVNAFRIGVVDIDTKDHKPLTHYASHEREILQAYLQGKGKETEGEGEGKNHRFERTS